MRAERSSTSDSALIGSRSERARSRGASTTGPESAAGGSPLPDDGVGGGGFFGTGGGGFFGAGSGGFVMRGSGAGAAEAFAGSGGGIDFFFSVGSGGGMDDFLGAAGASSCALGRSISDVGIAFIIFDGGSPDAIWSVRTCSSMSQPSSVSASNLSIELCSSCRRLLDSGARGGDAEGSGGGFDGFAGIADDDGGTRRARKTTRVFWANLGGVRARAVISFALLATSSCSLLVQFRDEPDAGDAALDAAPDVGLDVAREAEAAAPYDASHVCTGLMNGWYCGFNGLNGNPPTDWLVYCDGGLPNVRVCDAGCLAFPSGSPDCCDECPGNPNGTYCGSQFATYPSYNASYLISCGGGMAAIQMNCTNGCTPGPGTAACK